MERKFLLFYKDVKSNNLGHVWIYGEDELREELSSINSDNTEVLQVIEVFSYKEIDIDEFLDESN